MEPEVRAHQDQNQEVNVNAYGKVGRIDTFRNMRDNEKDGFYDDAFIASPEFDCLDGDDTAIVSVEVTYPTLPLTVFGWELHWLVIFFVVSMAAGFALRGPLGVEI